MRQPTDLMVKILKSSRAQAMIDYVANIYGESYVGLWLFEIEGGAIQTAYDIILDLRNQLSPLTATWALDYYEDEYGLSRGEGMTYEERRQRIKAQRNAKRQANPRRICDAVSAVLGGIDVEMVENYDDNTFLIKTSESIAKSDYAAMDNVLDTMKPAHLIYFVLADVEISMPEVEIRKAVRMPLTISITSLPQRTFAVTRLNVAIYKAVSQGMAISSTSLPETEQPDVALSASIYKSIAEGASFTETYLPQRS